MIGVKLKSTGYYLPEKILTNDDLSLIIDTNDEWIKRMTGMKDRHIAAENESTSDLCYKAALDALEKGNINANDIDMIIVGTSTPDLFFPATACIVQQKLGCRRGIPAFDYEIACSSYIYGMIMASQFINTGLMKNVLVIAGDLMSRFLDYSDRSTCVLFGDGASAFILSANSENHLLGFDWGANGYEPEEYLYIKGGGSRQFKDLKTPHSIVMNGPEIYRLAIQKMAESTMLALEKTELNMDDITYVIPHQANIRIMNSVMKHLKIPMEKLISTIEEHANTSGATVGIALDKAIQDGRIKRGDNLALTAFGAGLSWASVILKY